MLSVFTEILNTGFPSLSPVYTLHDEKAEEIWEKEGFELKGRSKSKWLAYNMAMRAKVFDDWTEAKLNEDPDALVIHLGCGMDSRCLRVTKGYNLWVDCDFPDVLEVRNQYYQESDSYRMQVLNAAHTEQITSLPDSCSAIVVLEGLARWKMKMMKLMTRGHLIRNLSGHA